MSDLIRRSDAITAVGYYSLHSGDKLLFADAPLEELPSVDAVEVVRCKDYRYWAYDCEGDFGIKYGRCSRWADAWGEHEPETTDRDYCSYADRKEATT